MTKQKLPVTTTAAKADQVLALPSAPMTIAETLAELGANLQKAVEKMDDITLDIDAYPGRVHVKLRAYKHRPANGGSG
jgi:hypothetical protein